MVGSPSEQQLELLRRELSQGRTWRVAAAACGLALTTAWVNATRRWPTLGTRRPRLRGLARTRVETAIADNEQSYSSVARQYNLSVDTVIRWARQLLEAREIPFVRTVPYRCGACGSVVRLRPCLICQARRWRTS